VSTTIQLDKRYTRDVDTLGTMNIRVVVVPKKADAQPVAQGDPDDFLLSVGKSPIDNYLERGDGRGKMCVLFQVNGHRQDFLDQSFIAKDLGFRYLRNRMLVMVELDGLTPEAFDNLLKGDRVGFFRGEVFKAICKRLVATLCEDPEIKKLEDEAEEQVAELQAGNEAILKKLDQLIEEHHRTEDVAQVPLPPGTPTVQRFGADRVQTVVVEHGGTPTAGPSLQSTGPTTIRMRPEFARVVEIRANPPESWSTITAFQAKVVPALEELRVDLADLPDGGRSITLCFSEGADADEDQYPIETKLQILAQFEGHPEPRLVEKSIVIGPPKEKPVKPPIKLLDVPTQLAIVTRQPVKLVPGGATAHIRVKWNGKDALTTGPKPAWKFRTRCTTIATFPAVGTTEPKNGRFELLIDAPRTLLAAQDLEFELEAVGPKGKKLVATLRARLEPPVEPEPPEPPGSKKRKVGELQSVPTRPYELRMITEADWDTGIPYWRRPQWDARSVGCFVAPTSKEPLVLMINADYEPLKTAKADMIKRSLTEATIEERITKYYTHVALHMYAMYRYRKQLEQAPTEETPSLDAMDELHEAEVERTAATLLHLIV
jgi:hypothetical protein